MKRDIAFVIALSIAVSTLNAQEVTLPCDSTRALRVLFVGNSFTYVSNMPKLVEAIAASLSGPCISASMIATGGATLEQHWQSDSVAQRIRTGGWTHVEDFTGSAVCMYNRRRFTPATIEGVLRAHPVVIAHGRVLRNPFFEPPELAFEKCPERRLEWMTEQINNLANGYGA